MSDATIWNDEDVHDIFVIKHGQPQLRLDDLEGHCCVGGWSFRPVSVVG